MNYYQFHIGDFRSGTINMSRHSRWIYRDMMDVYYDSEQPLPLDMDVLCDMLGVSSDEEKEIVRRHLRFKFDMTDVGYTHEVCEKVIAEYRSKADVARANGKLGGRPKGNQNKPSGFPPGSYKVSVCKQVETGSQTNHKPITNNQEPQESKSLVADDSATGVDDLFSGEPITPVKPKARAKPVVDYEAIMDSYNELCAGKGKLIGCDTMNAERKRLIDKALELKIAGEKPFKDYGIEYWRAYFSICPNDTHWCGVNDRGWRADFTFVLKEKNIIAALEKNNG